VPILLGNPSVLCSPEQGLSLAESPFDGTFSCMKSSGTFASESAENAHSASE